MFTRHTRATRALSVMLSLSLFQSQVSTGFTPPGLSNLFLNTGASVGASVSHALFFLNRLAIILQGGTSLDTLRANTPAAPDLPGGTNVPPASNYDDPKPGTTGNFAAYLTELSKAANDSGVAGGKPLQMADPTAGNAVAATAGGYSYNLGSRNYNFSAPILALPGRAGLGVGLALSYNSRVWTKAGNVAAFNMDKGFPAPGWRLGFGAIQGINSGGNVTTYANSVTGKASFLYIAPDGTRHDLAWNATSGLYESYDASYLDFNATTKVLRNTSGTMITFGDPFAGDGQLLPTQIRDRNGNYMTIVYKTLGNGDRVLDYVIDPAGRRVDFYYESNRLREIREDRNGVLYKFAIINYEPVTITPGLDASTTADPSNINGTQIYLPTRVTFPTGGQLRFYSDFHMCATCKESEVRSQKEKCGTAFSYRIRHFSAGALLTSDF